MKTSAIIIGAGGFVGSHLARALLNVDVTLQLCDLNTASLSGASVKKFDQRNERLSEQFKPAESLIILSGVSNDHAVRLDRKNAYAANIACIPTLLEDFSIMGGRHVIFASSEWVYAAATTSHVTVDPRANASPYGRQKLAAEIIIQDYCESYSLDFSLLRFGIIWGNRQKGSAVEGLAQACLKGHSQISVGNKKTARRFVHVEDICEGLKSIVLQRTAGSFDLQGRSIVTLEEIIQLTCEFTGRRPPEIIESQDIADRRIIDAAQIVDLPYRWHRHTFEEHVKNYISYFMEPR